MLCLGTKYLFHSMTHRWVCFLKCGFSGCIHKTGCTVTSGFWVELGDLKEIKPEDILIQMSSDILGILVLTLCKYTGFKVKCQLRRVCLAGMRQRDPHCTCDPLMCASFFISVLRQKWKFKRNWSGYFHWKHRKRFSANGLRHRHRAGSLHGLHSQPWLHAFTCVYQWPADCCSECKYNRYWKTAFSQRHPGIGLH